MRGSAERLTSHPALKTVAPRPSGAHYASVEKLAHSAAPSFPQGRGGGALFAICPKGRSDRPRDAAGNHIEGEPLEEEEAADDGQAAKVESGMKGFFINCSLAVGPGPGISRAGHGRRHGSVRAGRRPANGGYRAGGPVARRGMIADAKGMGRTYGSVMTVTLLSLPLLAT